MMLKKGTSALFEYIHKIPLMQKIMRAKNHTKFMEYPNAYKPFHSWMF